MVRVGPADRLSPGDHACLTFPDPEERFDAEQLLAFEKEVGELFADGAVTAICEYGRDSFDPVTLAYAARVHPGRSPPPPITRIRCCGSAASTRRPAYGWPASSTTAAPTR